MWSERLDLGRAGDQVVVTRDQGGRHGEPGQQIQHGCHTAGHHLLNVLLGAGLQLLGKRVRACRVIAVHGPRLVDVEIVVALPEFADQLDRLTPFGETDRPRRERPAPVGAVPIAELVEDHRGDAVRMPAGIAQRDPAAERMTQHCPLWNTKGFPHHFAVIDQGLLGDALAIAERIGPKHPALVQPDEVARAGQRLTPAMP
jgi:hypothetical protein